jgi:pimeloyl-ACP methyl ester carboxylesterase
VLLLWGSADPISPVAVGERLRELIPDSELVVVDGGSHDLIFERANDVIEPIRRHLQKTTRP